MAPKLFPYFSREISTDSTGILIKFNFKILFTAFRKKVKDRVIDLC